MKPLNHPWIFGHSLLWGLIFLAVVIGLGKVEQSTSHGLDMVLGSLITLAGGFCNWAFGKPKDDSAPKL